MEASSALLALCEGNPPVTGGFPSQRPVTRSFDVFFDLRLNKWLSIKVRRRWFETPWYYILGIIVVNKRAPYQYKDHLYGYRDFHYKDKTGVRPSYLYNGNSYTGKMMSLYCWDSLRFITISLLLNDTLLSRIEQSIREYAKSIKGINNKKGFSVEKAVLSVLRTASAGMKTPWWCHDREMLSVLLALCEGNTSVTDGRPHKVQ